MNKVILTGRTTKDIEVKTSASGTTFAKFTVAVQAGKDKADFINCTAFGKTAELLEKYVHKGNRIGIEGRLNISPNNYADVTVDAIEFLESKKEVEK